MITLKFYGENVLLLLIGHEPGSILKVSTKLDWRDNPEIQKQGIFRGQSETKITLFVRTKIEYEEILRITKAWGFKIYYHRSYVEKDSGPRPQIRPWKLRKDDFWDGEFINLITLELNLEDFEKFLELLKTLSKELSYRVLYWDTQKIPGDINPLVLK